MSLHWSITQFSGGMDEVTPESPAERVFAILVYILAFITASLFVSSLTSSMTQLNIIGSQQSQQLSVLRRYLKQNHISNHLAMRVNRNAQHAILEQQRLMPESSVKMLFMVSEPLRVELHFEMFAPVLAHHPFFDAYRDECPQVMRRVCHRAAAQWHVSAGDVIFDCGEVPSPAQMYVIVMGHMRYILPNGDGAMLAHSNWLSEAALWIRWVHCGALRAAANSRLCTINAQDFQDIVAQFKHHGFQPSDYAADFVKALAKCDIPSDLPIGTEETFDSLAGHLLRTARHNSSRTYAKPLRERMLPK